LLLLLFYKKYSYRSQRGFYPEDPLKENQDKYGITLNFGGEAGDAMFTVYDGHGSEGSGCAAFAKKRLPQSLAKFLRQRRASTYMASLRAEGKSTKGGWNPNAWPLLDKEEYEQCCVKAFTETNRLMHEHTSVSLPPRNVETDDCK
jgi:serine/threonine protein phosphatase PrpC